MYRERDIKTGRLYQINRQANSTYIQLIAKQTFQIRPVS